MFKHKSHCKVSSSSEPPTVPVQFSAEICSA